MMQGPHKIGHHSSLAVSRPAVFMLVIVFLTVKPDYRRQNVNDAVRLPNANGTPKAAALLEYFRGHIGGSGSVLQTPRLPAQDVCSVSEIEFVALRPCFENPPSLSSQTFPLPFL